MVHGGSASRLHRVQVAKGDGALKQLVRDHGEGIHVHLCMHGTLTAVGQRLANSMAQGNTRGSKPPLLNPCKLVWAKKIASKRVEPSVERHGTSLNLSARWTEEARSLEVHICTVASGRMLQK